MGKRNDDFFLKKKSWSVVKDELLRCYLTPYVAKILTTRKPLLYVDCFSGAGKFADGNIGSPLIALNIFAERIKGRGNKLLEANFIESNHAEMLIANLSSYMSSNDLKISIHSGTYEKNIRKILEGKSQYNLFLYLDPYGVKHLDFDFLCSLREFNSTELLLNFNSFGFLRVACKLLKMEFENEVDFDYLAEYDAFSESDATEKMLNIVAGGDYWKGIVSRYYRDNAGFCELENAFTKEFCDQLKKHYRYVLNMAIRAKEGHVPKYRMIHVTNHPDGAILMADNISKREELLKDIQLKGQQTLFGTDLGGDDVKNSVRDFLASISDFRRLKVIMAEFFTEYGVQCNSGDIIEIIESLEKKGELEIIREPKTTETGQPSRFYREIKGRTVKLKWKHQIA